MIASCLDCQRAVRPHGVRKEEAPGTIVLAARGRCARCYNKIRGQQRGSRSSAGVPAVTEVKVDIAHTPCVLVRADLTPATYKALTRANIDIGKLFAQFADNIAGQLSDRDPNTLKLNLQITAANPPKIVA